MHEYSTAKGILETVLAVAFENKAKRVTEVNLEIGILTMLNPEQLEFSFHILSENTIAEDAKLNIAKLPMNLNCRGCGYKGEISSDKIGESPDVIELLKCPRCGSADTEVDEGRNCNIKNIRVNA
jgi:hydrogenase nickel incorporation protein HypA/HybF